MTETLISKEFSFGAKNYYPIPVVFVKSKGVHLWDENGIKYLDMVSAYSAVSLGHSNPKIIKALCNQAKNLGVTSRAFHNNVLPSFLEKLATLSGFDKVLPMNSGAEAVETALKLARKWGEKIKQVPKDKGHIIACHNNFHGRTLGVVALSTDPQYRDGFGPFMPGVSVVPFNDPDALEAAITDTTVAFIVEPIQGEAGIITPSEGYLSKVREICNKHNVLLIVDEVQTGMGRTGKLFCFEHDAIRPDIVAVGKALGGGLYPVSAVLADKQIMDVITPGDHGSTFGGNPLASAVAIASLDQLSSPELLEHVTALGGYALKFLKKNLAKNSLVKDIRGKGLFIGIEFVPEFKAKKAVLALMEKGVLTKDTHECVIRLAPPLVIKKSELKRALNSIVDVLNSLADH